MFVMCVCMCACVARSPSPPLFVLPLSADSTNNLVVQTARGKLRKPRLLGIVELDVKRSGLRWVSLNFPMACKRAMVLKINWDSATREQERERERKRERERQSFRGLELLHSVMELQARSVWDWIQFLFINGFKGEPWKSCGWFGLQVVI